MPTITNRDAALVVAVLLLLAWSAKDMRRAALDIRIAVRGLRRISTSLVGALRGRRKRLLVRGGGKRGG